MADDSIQSGGSETGVPSTDGIERHDHGVAPAEGYVCQNFEDHPDKEPKMRGGPFNGVMCPECGRIAGHPENDIPFSDPPHESPKRSTTDTDR